MDDARRRLEGLLVRMIAGQERRLHELAQRTVPGVTPEDLLLPDDVPELRDDPDFLYEAGLLAGLLSAQAAVRAEFAGPGGGD